MIVRIEPFGHLTGSSLSITTGHCKIKIKPDVAAIIRVPWRYNSKHNSRIQHMVIKSKIIYRNKLNSCLLLGLQMLQLNCCHFGAELLLIYFPLPVGFQCLFPFAVLSDSRISKIAYFYFIRHLDTLPLPSLISNSKATCFPIKKSALP
ncbi:hypothetical protein D3C76_1304320 [compost metagenome]